MSNGAEHGSYTDTLEIFTGVIGDDLKVHYPGLDDQMPTETADSDAPLPPQAPEPEVEAPPSQPEAPAAQRYAGMLGKAATAYANARTRRDEDNKLLRQHRAWAEFKLDTVYEKNNHPYLAPHRLRAMQQADAEYLTYINPETSYEGYDLGYVMYRYAHGMTDADSRHSLAIMTAVASTRQFDGAETYRDYIKALRDPGVQNELSRYVGENLGLFYYGGVEDLDAEELTACNPDPKTKPLDPALIAMYKQLPRGLPRDNVPELPHLEAPPLHLTQLAVDVLNRNSDSVAPTGIQAWLNGHRPPIGTDLFASRITEALGNHVARRYGFDEIPDRRLLAVLAECDLAERQGFMNAGIEAQQRTANRVSSIFAKVKPEQIPDDARDIFDACRRLAPRFRELGKR